MLSYLGEAKSVVRSVLEKSLEQDGCAALVALNQRFDARTPATLMQGFIAAVSPPIITDIRQVPKATIVEWEGKVHALKNKHGEELGDNIRLAIFVGMLPKEYQDLCFQMGSTAGQRITFHEVRDRVVNLANQKISSCTPTPIEVDGVQGEDWGEGNSEDEPNGPWDGPWEVEGKKLELWPLAKGEEIAIHAVVGASLLVSVPPRVREKVKGLKVEGRKGVSRTQGGSERWVPR